MSVLLDGKAVARALRNQTKDRVSEVCAAGGLRPHLAAVLIGDNPASETYVSMKRKACGWVGIDSSVHRLAPDTSQSEAEDLIDALSSDPTVTGVLIQHPVPRHLDEQAVLDRLVPQKDVDGLSTSNLGALLTGRRGFAPCTPAGIIALLDHYQIPLEGRRVVVIGRSIILGKPMALLMLNRHATVTICHTRTRDLADWTRSAEILVAAAGQPEMIRADMVEPGAVVVDAGYSRITGRDGDVGDVEYAGVSTVASYITPVPGGVGPMTIAMLLSNTTRAAELALGLQTTWAT